MGKTIKKKLKRVGVSALILTLSLFAYGFYSVYSFDKSSTPKLTTMVSPAIEKPTPPPKPAANAPESVFIEALDSPVLPGSNTSMIINAVAGSTCSVSLSYGQMKAVDSGLVAKKADVYGNITWSWTIPSNAPAGNWPVTVLCRFNQKTAVVTGNLQVNPPN